MKKTKNSTKEKVDNSSISSLLSRLEKIEKKLDLINTMGKSMPVFILSLIAVVGSIAYLSLNSFIPATDKVEELPQTGEGVRRTSDFTISYPKNEATITLPYTIIAKTTSNPQKIEKVKFWRQYNAKEKKLIEDAQYNPSTNEFTVTWSNTPSRKYKVWAEIKAQDGYTYFSFPITVYVK